MSDELRDQAEGILTSQAEKTLVFRPVFDLGSGEASHRQPAERDLVPLIEAYYSRLSPAMRQSYAPPESLVQMCLANYDPHFLFLVDQQKQGSQADKVQGLLVFNQDTTVNRKEVKEANGELSLARETKVLLHHLSVLNEAALDEYVDLGLDFIWKTMHCTSIKAQLHHFMQEDPKAPGTQKLRGNDALKSLFKKRVFRWKTLKNERNGFRIETLEGPNCHYKEQLRPETAFIYRRGLQKSDIHKDSVNISIANRLSVGPAAKPTEGRSQGAAMSLSSLVADVINLRRNNPDAKPYSATLDTEADDRYANLRRQISNNAMRDCMAGVSRSVSSWQDGATQVRLIRIITKRAHVPCRSRSRSTWRRVALSLRTPARCRWASKWCSTCALRTRRSWRSSTQRTYSSRSTSCRAWTAP